MQSLTMINRRHRINASYFDSIDTPEKAYWLGFVWADGCISKTTTRASGPNRMRLAQKWSERHHLERFNKTIEADYSITCVKHPNGAKVAQLDVNCRPFCEARERLGYDVKAKRVHVPAIPKALLPHFVRGYFDGDGCLSLYDQTVKQWTVHKQEWSITGQRGLMAEIKTILTADAGVTPSVELKQYKRSPDTASVRYGKKADVAKLHDYLYQNASVYLESKHQKFVDFLSRYAS